jgi:3-phenylpropionate/trans-cinnamate dioxygenase ferredoxin reductase subunit
VHHLRTVEDADRLRAALQPGARIVVIGAGFIGSEVASAARARGAEVTVIEALAAPLLRVVGARVGTACAELAARAGVSVRPGESVTSVEEGAGEVVVTTSGGRYAADAVVVGIGIEPDLDVARASGLAVDNGVLVDEHCRSSVPQVYAVGDIANHQHPLFGERIRVEHFDNASKQAAAAASTIAGRPVAASDPHWFWSDQHGANLQHVGHASSWDDVVIRGSLGELEFTAFYLQGGRLRAAFAVDRGEDVAAVRELLAARVPVRPELLADPDVDLAELVAAECPA